MLELDALDRGPWGAEGVGGDAAKGDPGARDVILATVAAGMARRIEGRGVAEDPRRVRGEVPAPSDPREDARERAGGDGERPAGREEGLRALSGTAILSAGVLVGGGAGKLAGVALGAINPFVFGVIGVMVGVCASARLVAVARGRPQSGPGRRCSVGRPLGHKEVRSFE